MTFDLTSRPEPYRLFFPLGVILGLLGTAIWPMYYWGWITGYWGLSHAYMQAEGFLFAFIAGFLLTAVPRFTGTPLPELRVQLMIAIPLALGALGMELQNYALGHVAFAIAFLSLAVIIVGRFINKRGKPPVTYPLIGLAVVTGACGAVINAATGLGLALDPTWILVAKRAVTEGMTLMLVLGVGGFLGPRLLGFDRLPVIKIDGVASARDVRAITLNGPGFYLVAALAIMLTLVGEYAFGLQWLSFVRAFAASSVIILTLEPWKLPMVRSTLAWCVWAANIFVLLALWLVAFFPRYQVDFLHVLFIGGFALLILAVGMRVTLSHGGHGSAPEERSWPLRVGLTTGLIAMLARAGAPFSPRSYADHLVWAALLWIIGLGFWGWRLTRIILSKRLPGESR